ncbi:MAG: hypothetical protein KZQ74_02185 [gamma proteobacterium symbiont of Bathyaustriella thionipta]|nr:hypothetical protein [gamma proteobacterium symbiont of Bathyaustriella thionipta]MCU7951563.1 hypothetical protein [gamma proteobacterium symbiont of Bathyaustriella thionipta]MCU7958162.1 hypothetical protein [gamma proteobacterium symbiont of Bathyaustriella thionipta]MCU7966005.1 hypothetical protein [gamma proteobacterium symbiont of Bathyaustriella thionipta]
MRAISLIGALSQIKAIRPIKALCKAGSTLMVFFYSALLLSAPQSAEFELNKTYLNSDCLSCHEKNNVEIVKAWHDSSHSDKPKNSEDVGKSIADCVQCHGSSHNSSNNNALAKSRSDSACITCHGGSKAPVVHSYSTSKHGVILTMRKKRVDWNKPLKSANYRVPGCAYCHMYNTEHNTKKSIRPNKISSTNANKISSKELQRQTLSVCSNCHAPRYIRRLFENGERMLLIAGKKLNEARTLVDNISHSSYIENEKQSAPESDHLIDIALKKEESIKKQFHKMEKHYKNVYLGIAHQSPDYQWWHGQPALDGDLLKIKAMISDIQREATINSHNKK